MALNLVPLHGVAGALSALPLGPIATSLARGLGTAPATRKLMQQTTPGLLLNAGNQITSHLS